MAPGHFSATSSERIDKMYKEVSAGRARLTKLCILFVSTKTCLLQHLSRPHAKSSILQVHDYAQLLKECEKQIKLLETATTGVDGPVYF